MGDGKEAVGSGDWQCLERRAVEAGVVIHLHDQLLRLGRVRQPLNDRSMLRGHHGLGDDAVGLGFTGARGVRGQVELKGVGGAVASGGQYAAARVEVEAARGIATLQC